MSVGNQSDACITPETRRGPSDPNSLLLDTRAGVRTAPSQTEPRPPLKTEIQTPDEDKMLPERPAAPTLVCAASIPGYQHEDCVIIQAVGLHGLDNFTDTFVHSHHHT